MPKKFIIPITPQLIFIIGIAFGELQNELAQSIVRYKPVCDALVVISLLKDTKRIESIGKEAENWWNEIYDKYSSQENAHLDSQDHEMLKLSITRWEVRLAEIHKNWILLYPDTHIDISKLREGINAFLHDNKLNTLNTLERQGLEESISSLLSDNFISAEFMSLRTAESLLKRWYEKRTDNKLGKTTWGDVLDKLTREFPQKMERPKELLLLDYLRERRNEIAHPEAISDSIQASTTFLNVISLCKSIHL